MKLKAKIEIEIPDEMCQELLSDGLWPQAFLHDEVDIAMSSKAEKMGYSITGIKVGKFTSGTLSSAKNNHNKR